MVLGGASGHPKNFPFPSKDDFSDFLGPKIGPQMDPLPGFSRFGGPFGGNLRIFVARECFGRGLGAILGALGPILGALGALLGRIFDVYVV